ncbi:MAG TPA: hypothetical protein VE685_19555 [Thermoanaerobaculia bacterium]|nr:hypothetical protein [Thermoanaerobaculia bacterium]
MRWRKGGRIYVPSGERWWARSYATIPTVEPRGDVLRVYFAGLDEERRGRIGFVDVDARDPARILGESTEPVLDIGAPGLFDDSGVNPSCVVAVGGRRFLYYIGWQRCERVPYMLFAGLAVAQGDGPFERLQSVPVLDRTPPEPFLRSATSVHVEDSRFRAWYVSGEGWVSVGGRPLPTYVIRTAESSDGLHWESREEPCLSFADADEFGFGRPWVVRDAGGYRMWYSIRSRSRPYRMGYAESADGILWTRRDGEVGLERSAEGWDSEMICYPCVVDAAGSRYMFYNGNGHGASGFGYAVLEEP